MLTRILMSLLGIMIFQSAFAQDKDCNVGIFKDVTHLSVDSAENLAVLYALSESEYKELKETGNAEGSYGPISGSASYGQFRRNVRERAERLGIRSLSSYSSALATSRLTSNGLEAYKACVAQGGGMALVAEDIGSSSYRLGWRYTPQADNACRDFSVASLINVSEDSAAQVHKLVDNDTCDAVDKSFVIMPKDRTKDVSVTIASEDVSRSLTLPPIAEAEGLSQPSLRRMLTRTYKSDYESKKGYKDSGKIAFGYSCKQHSDCESGTAEKGGCYVGPFSDEVRYCNHRDANCAFPGSLGSMYGHRLMVDGVLYECRFQEDGARFKRVSAD